MPAHFPVLPGRERVPEGLRVVGLRGQLHSQKPAMPRKLRGHLHLLQRVQRLQVGARVVALRPQVHSVGRELPRPVPAVVHPLPGDQGLPTAGAHFTNL
jgi:hypothetical protein